MFSFDCFIGPSSFFLFLFFFFLFVFCFCDDQAQQQHTCCLDSNLWNGCQQWVVMVTNSTYNSGLNDFSATANVKCGMLFCCCCSLCGEGLLIGGQNYLCNAAVVLKSQFYAYQSVLSEASKTCVVLLGGRLLVSVSLVCTCQ